MDSINDCDGSVARIARFEWTRTMIMVGYMPWERNVSTRKIGSGCRRTVITLVRYSYIDNAKREPTWAWKRAFSGAILMSTCTTYVSQPGERRPYKYDSKTYEEEEVEETGFDEHQSNFLDASPFDIRAH